MHSLCTLYALFLLPLFTVSTTVPLPSDSRNDTSDSLLKATEDTANSRDFFNPHFWPISLSIHVFGFELPPVGVNAAFTAARVSIHPFLQSQPNRPITDDAFQCRAVGGSVQLLVTASLPDAISWHELNIVLLEIYYYMNGHTEDRQRHMQELSFDIIKAGMKIGYGLVAYYRSHSLRYRDPTLANRKNTDDKKLLLVHTDPSLDVPTANAIHFRVPNTPFILVVSYLSDAIPSLEVLAAFEGSHSQILASLSGQPTSPIPGSRYMYSEKGVQITVVAIRGIFMTWKQLSWILGGMYGFMSGPPEHYQILFCEISSASQGSVGYASVSYLPPTIDAKGKRALFNATAHLPILDPIPSGTIRFPVPDTPIVLTFTYIGTSIPRLQLDAAILAALDQISPFWRHHGTDPVPGNNFYRILDGVHIRVVANVPYVMSWNQLRAIVWGLLLFVDSEEGGEEHYRLLNFEVDDLRTGKLAHGAVRYLVLRIGNAGKAGESRSSRRSSRRSREEEEDEKQN